MPFWHTTHPALYQPGINPAFFVGIISMLTRHSSQPALYLASIVFTRLTIYQAYYPTNDLAFYSIHPAYIFCPGILPAFYPPGILINPPGLVGILQSWHCIYPANNLDGRVPFRHTTHPALYQPGINPAFFVGIISMLTRHSSQPALHLAGIVFTWLTIYQAYYPTNDPAFYFIQHIYFVPAYYRHSTHRVTIHPEYCFPVILLSRHSIQPA